MSFAEDRLKICSTCPYNSDGTCVLCGCELAIKVTKESESCPHVPPKWDTADKHVVKNTVAPAGASGGPSQAVDAPGCIPCHQHR